MPQAKKADNVEVEVIAVTRSESVFYVRGSTPLILNRMSEKAKRELLLPRGRKNAAEKAVTLKHNPIEEYRASVYRMREGPTALGIYATAFKGAMCTAALDLPGTQKTKIERLTYVMGDLVAVYGVPELLMAVTRSADINRTPDVRTRAILREWACEVRIGFTEPLMRGQMVARLLAAAGLAVGVGDWRNEKGSGNYGLFEIVPANDADFVRIVANGGRDVQVAALDTPACYDDETAELLSWYDEEMAARHLRGVA